MKRFFGFALIAGLLSIPAFAAKNAQTLTIPTAVKVGTTQLSAGEYKISWTGANDNAQLTIEQKGKTPVTVPAKIVDAKNGHVGVVTNTVNGAEVLQTIQLNKLSLVLTGATANGE